MITHINYQTIFEDGRPIFAVIPYREFLKIYPEAKEAKHNGNVPHEVVKLMIKKGLSRIRAWREFLGFTQEEISEKMSITQAALSQMEKPKARLRKATLEKLAKAMGLTIEQLK